MSQTLNRSSGAFVSEESPLERLVLLGRSLFKQNDNKLVDVALPAARKGTLICCLAPGAANNLSLRNVVRD